MPASERVPRRRRRAAVGLLMAAVALLAAGCGGPGGAAGDAGGSAGAIAGGHGSALAGQHPVRPAAGSPLSPGWTGEGKPVTLAFGGDVHFEGVLAARLAANPSTALAGPVRRLVAGADVAVTNLESALTRDADDCPEPLAK